MDCYENTIKRHVYEAGGKRFLNKNVFFSTRVRSVYEKFPDAVFVYLVRDPHDCLPSFLNMFYQAWKAHSPSIRPDGEEIQALKRLGRTTQLVVYPGEHHGIRKPSFRKDRWQRYLDWLDRYVKGGEAASAAATRP